ncbi:hypothetical protein BHM03_00002822 [Ensete ventricosum]|nr:hypothetical protein BHM03_00002822 [Ensete ventricosum]
MDNNCLIKNLTFGRGDAIWVVARVPFGLDGTSTVAAGGGLIGRDLRPANMTVLVNEESSVGEDAFVWLASSIPLVADVVNARFTFETLTAPTASRLHFPAYDTFLKKMDK